MLIASVLITLILILASAYAFFSFKMLEESTDRYIKLEEQALSLMEASDYLTDEVQCYTVIGKRVYLDNYFNDVFEVRRREKAF